MQTHVCDRIVVSNHARKHVLAGCWERKLPLMVLQHRPVAFRHVLRHLKD